MEDFISLAGKKQRVEEFDVLKLTRDPGSPPVTHDTSPRLAATQANAHKPKPFYPTCKRVLTRAPFSKKPVILGSLGAAKKQDKSEQVVVNGNGSPAAHSTKPSSSVANISLRELMSVDENQSTEKTKVTPSVEQDDRIVRLRNMLKQAEAEKSTLQGYVADLQAKLAAVPKRQSSKACETQTDENGNK